MVYQELYLGNPPYILGTRFMTYCCEHKHPEIEFLYCIKGTFDVIVGKTAYTMSEGDVAIISSMMPHEVPDTKTGPDAVALVLEVGPLMLGNYFNMLKSQLFSQTVINLKKPEHKELYSLFKEIVALKESPEKFSNLAISGNVYKICSVAFNSFAVPEKNTELNNSVSAIATAMEYIHNNYNKKFTVDEVAELCGYSKSNFCKVFKTKTGDTFHNVLNKYRVKIACILIKNGELTLDEVATQVGFADAKSFHKVFKTEKGITPGTYKKNKYME